MSITLNADFCAKPEAAGINLANVAEEALAQRSTEQARADICQDLAALNAFVDAHGSFPEMARKRYRPGPE